MQFLYMGFSQQANVRIFRFQGVMPRERPTRTAKNLEFMLSADMALLAQYRIRVQDGPTLCLQILAAAFTSEEEQAVLILGAVEAGHTAVQEQLRAA